MKAIFLYKYGSTNLLELKEVEKPIPADNEVLIRIHAAALSISDSMSRAGKPFITRFFTGLLRPKNPILGSEFAGEIEEVGKNAKGFNIGDKVFGSSGSKTGCYAEYLCISDKGFLALMPEKITYEEAAHVCGALASWNFLNNKIKIHSGQKILILGAYGNIGTPAIQVAKYFGAEVTAVCNVENSELMKSLGVDKIIDENKNNFAKNGETYDIIFDTQSQSSFSKCKDALKKNGVYLKTFPGLVILLQMLWTSMTHKKKAIFSATGLLPVQKRIRLLNDLIKLIEQGKVRTVIDRCFPLEQIAEAFRYAEEEHKKGNVVITM